MQEMRVRALGQEDPLEKGMDTHSSILAWRIRGAWRATVHGVTKVSDDLTTKQQQHSQYYQFSILLQRSLSLSPFHPQPTGNLTYGADLSLPCLCDV